MHKTLLVNRPDGCRTADFIAALSTGCRLYLQVATGDPPDLRAIHLGKPIVTSTRHYRCMSSLDPAAGQIDLTTAVVGQRSPYLLDKHLSLQTPALRETLAIWEQKRGTRSMPQRTDFSIRDLVKVLPQTGIVELQNGVQEPRFFVRLNGSALDHFFAPLTGRYFDEAVSPYFVERWTTIFMAPVNARAPMRGLGRTEFRNQTFLVAETLLLPISQDGETPSGVLYSIFHYSSNEVNARRAQVYAALVEEYERYCRDEVTSKA